MDSFLVKKVLYWKESQSVVLGGLSDQSHVWKTVLSQSFGLLCVVRKLLAGHLSIDCGHLGELYEWLDVEVAEPPSEAPQWACSLSAQGHLKKIFKNKINNRNITYLWFCCNVKSLDWSTDWVWITVFFLYLKMTLKNI